MNKRTWRENMDYLLSPKRERVLIASHRGKFGAGVLENTLLAFRLALQEGADMVEMDICKTKDGVLIVHHDRTLERLLRDPARVEERTLAEIAGKTVMSYYQESGAEGIETFNYILDGLKDQGILVLDRCWGSFDEVYDALIRHGMKEQSVFKFRIEDKAALEWARLHRDLIYIPMTRDQYSGSEYMETLLELKRNGSVPGVELVVRKETDAVFQTAYIENLHDEGFKIWSNALCLSKDDIYGAGYDDNRSLKYGGDKGWGVQIDKGVDIIQTDWPFELSEYLAGRGIRPLQYE